MVEPSVHPAPTGKEIEMEMEMDTTIEKPFGGSQATLRQTVSTSLIFLSLCLSCSTLASSYLGWSIELFIITFAGLTALSCVYLLICDTLLPSDETVNDRLDTPSDPVTGDNISQLATIGRLAGGVAHDFNNSLMVLLNCIEMLRDAEDSMTRQKLITDMESAAKGAQSTASQLMSLSEEGSTPGLPSDPRAALRSVASNLRRMLPDNIVVKDMLRGTPAVTLVSGQFEQVILNICLNSKDAMPGGGTLTLRCFQDPLEEEVVIEIEDTSAQQHIGLPENSASYQTIKRIGGRLGNREMSASGNCITLTIPITESCSDKVETANSAPANANMKALLIDDNELVLAMLSTRLQEAGYIVSTALSVKDANRLVADQTFDALVCDAILTDGTPLSVIESFRNHSHGPIVICSGYPKDDPLLAELDKENAAFLQKPFSTDELLQKLAEEQCAA